MHRVRELGDLTWLKHLTIGRVLEEFTFEGHRAVALRVPDTGRNATGQFHLRLLFFPPGASRPVLSVNLESSILGEYLLTLQSAGMHRNLGPVPERLDYPAFKERALQAARAELSPD